MCRNIRTLAICRRGDDRHRGRSFGLLPSALTSILRPAGRNSHRMVRGVLRPTRRDERDLIRKGEKGERGLCKITRRVS